MAFDDIQIHSAPGGGPWILHYQFEGSETFGRGDVVSSDQDGQVSEGADELAPEDLLGIAMGGPGAPTGTYVNPRTNAAYADGDRFPVCIPTPTTLFRTQNFTTNGTTFSNAAPAVANIGDVVSLAFLSATTWGVEVGGTAASAVGVIVDILNSRMESILDTGETLATTDTFWVVFTINSHQHSATAEMIGATA